MKPKWNKAWKRWEIEDKEADSMRGLCYDDLGDMADEHLLNQGIEPGMNEELVDELVSRYSKKYGVFAPMPNWAKLFMEEYTKAYGVCKPSPESVEAMLRRNANI